MININLKEIFPVDSQSDLSTKLNFNFNQLLSLGFGERGESGPAGEIGPIGPIGPIGVDGTPGSQIFSTTPLLSPAEPPIVPSEAIIGDYIISSTGIYKKSTVSDWNLISNFTDIFTEIASASTSTWQLGVQTVSAESGMLIPIRSSTGIDRKTGSGTSGSEWSTNDPNWVDEESAYQNSQVTVFNFDPRTTKIYTEAAGSNGYGITINTDRQGETPLSDTFPYTALLSLYSFYNTANSNIEPDQFDEIDGGATGYRHQIELGSVDNSLESLVSGSGSANYVISPTWQNLRIRKYRTVASTLPGGLAINTDFNLSSPDDNTTPALNSRFTWRINKKTSLGSGTGTNITLALSNSKIESDTTAKITGIGVDGLHLMSDNFKLAIGIDPTNSGLAKNALISSDSAGSINRVIFNNLPIDIKSTSGAGSTASLTSTSLSSDKSLTIGTTGLQTDVIVTSGGSGRSAYLISPANNQNVYIGWSTGSTSSAWTTSSGYAIKTKKNRLDAGLPFPASTSAVPPASSTDSNVLDEYMEIEFTPAISWGNLPTPGTNVLRTSLSTPGEPTIADEEGYFIKIGKMIHFNIRFRITDWQARVPGTSTGSVYPGGANRDLALLDYGNLSTSATNPFAQLKLGSESNPIVISNLPDHWPSMYVSRGGIKFNVTVTTPIVGEPALRGNPFIYSWGGTGTGGNAGTAGTSGTSSVPWPALDPASIYAVMQYENNGAINLPRIELWGNRRYPLIDGQEELAGAVSPVSSKVSVYDFLRPFGYDRDIWVNVSGSYMTNHQSTNTAIPFSGGGGGGA
jgi:hypothetical protein